MIQCSRFSTLFALLFLVFVAGPAWATPVPVTVPVTIGGTDYNIAWQVGTFTDVNASVGLTGEDWWGDEGLAIDLAAAIGFQSDGDVHTSKGPLFAYSYGHYVCAHEACLDAVFYDSISDDVGSGNYTIGATFAFAYDAGLPIPSVPAPPALILFAFGLAGLGLAKRRIGKAQA
jgi:hypothetical protein